MKPDTIDKFAGFLAAIAACSTASGTAPVAISVAAAATTALGLAKYFGRNGNAGLEKTLNRFKKTLEREWEKWGEHSSHAHEGERKGAVKSFEEVLGLITLDGKKLVGLGLDAKEISNYMLKQAVLVHAGAYSPESKDPGVALARKFLQKLTFNAFNYLTSQKDFVDQLIPALWKQALEDMSAIKQDTTELKEKADRGLDELAEIKALLLAQSDPQKIAELEAELTSLHKDKTSATNLLKILLDRKITPENWGKALKQAEKLAEELLDQVARIPNDISESLRDLKLEAEKAIKARDLDRAEDLFIQIRQARAEAREKAVYDEAEAIADIAQTVAAKLDYLRAADLYKEAAEVPGLSKELQWEYQMWRANILQNHGTEFGSTTALQQARNHYENTVLHLCPRKDAPRNWATTQNNLGNVLQVLGERRGNETLLERAVAAYENALKERTRTGVPLDWATTQNNLGAVLDILGQRQGDEALLQRAVTAYENALKEWTRERVPLDWAMTQNNLGIVLRILGKGQGDETLLERAVTAYENALKERAREQVPLDWAMTQNNLGNVLRVLGERRGDETLLERTVTAYENALKEWTRKRVPFNWAMTQNNLGTGLQTLGERQGDEALLERAVTAYETALKEWTRERVPLNWAGTVHNQSGVQIALARMRKDLLLARRAVENSEMALEAFEKHGHGPHAELARTQLKKARKLVAELEGKKP